MSAPNRRAGTRISAGPTKQEHAHPDNVQIPVRICLDLADLAVFEQVLEVIGPLCPQLVGAGQTAVAAAHDERLNAVFDEVERRLAAPVQLAKGGRASSTD